MVHHARTGKGRHKSILIYRGETRTVQSGTVCASAWLDRKVVMKMYTGYDPKESGTVSRRVKDGTKKSFPCPIALVEYNKYMGGVDRGDQLRGDYHVRMKSRKFYKYIANFLLDVSITNAFVFYCSSHPGTKVNIKKFREVLARQLISDYCSRKRPGRGANTHLGKKLPLQHFPTKVPSANTRKRGRCKECTRRKDTQWFCRECGVWLCHPGTSDDCFLKWHKRIL